MGDGVDPQPRRLAPADAAIEQIDLFGNFLEQRVERLVQEFEPGDLGVVQIDDDAAALGLIDARLAQRFLEPLRGGSLGRSAVSASLRLRPHMTAT